MNGKDVNIIKGIDSQLLMQQLCSNIPVGIVVSNFEGVIFNNNVFRKWIPDFPVSNDLWYKQIQPYLEHSPNLKNVTVKWLLDSYIDNEKMFEMNWQGQKFFFRINISPLLDENNDIYGLIEVTENVTEFKDLEKSLQHARRFETVGRLASGIAHDFNNILQVINGHSEMLLELRKDDQKLVKSLDIILTSGQKASALTRQLLLFSRRQQRDFKQVNLGEMISNMQKILSRMLGEDISIMLECNDMDYFVDGDESQLEQIIMNLAINARDAMPEGGMINIITSLCTIDESMQEKYQFGTSGSYICLNFSDNGSGIPADVVEHIFEPFFTTKESGKGTGLGLATTYSIIKQHQGYITVDSKPGEGTCFRIYLPISSKEKYTETAFAVKSPQTGNRKRVLIVEDDDNVRELALQVLSHYGYEVECASCILQANDIIRDNTFDLFFIDIVLPDGNGAVFWESLEGDNAEAAFILSSGYTEDKPQIKNTIHKGYTFLHKPFTINSLLNSCTDALQSKHKIE